MGSLEDSHMNCVDINYKYQFGDFQVTSQKIVKTFFFSLSLVGELNEGIPEI